MSTLFPLDVAVIVEGEPMMARFESRVKTETDAFHVVFSDGHADHFYLMGEDAGSLPPVGMRYGSMKHGMALKGDIDIINQLKEGQWFLHWPAESDGICNIWLFAEKDYWDAHVLYVSYDGSCKFSIIKEAMTGKWNLGAQYDGVVTTNREMLKQVLNGLDKYLKLLHANSTVEILEVAE